MKIEELKRLYNLHKKYNKHDYGDGVCSCGKIFPGLKNDIRPFFTDQPEAAKILDHLIKINESYCWENILLQYLELTDDFETFKKYITKDRDYLLKKLPIKYLNKIYEEKIPISIHSPIFEENWEIFKYKEDYLKNRIIKIEDITKILELTDPKLIPYIKLAKNLKYTLNYTEKLKSKLDQIYNLLSYNLHITTTYQIFLETIKEKRIYFAQKIDLVKSIQIFIDLFEKFPNEIQDYPTQLDKKFANSLKFIPIKPDEPYNPKEKIIFKQNSLYKIKKEDI